MLEEDRLRKLKSFREELDSQDAIVLEASKADHAVPSSQADLIEKIFKSIRTEFPNSIPEFVLKLYFFGYDPHDLLAKISYVRSAVQGIIEAHEREAKRYELRLSVDAAPARKLLKDRIDEGDVFANDPGYALRYQGEVQRWIDRTVGTLNQVFSSQLNAQDFTRRVQPRPENLLQLQVDPRIDARSGVEFLRSIDEQLYILQHPPTKVEAKTMGKKIFVGHG